jgi:hypothetical protein
MGSRLFSSGQMPAHDLILDSDDGLVAGQRRWLSERHRSPTLADRLRRHDERPRRLIRRSL